MKRKRFPDISADAFVADTDRMALKSLQAIPLLPKLVHKFFESGLDRWMYCYNMATSVRCGPKQYGTIYAITKECSEILDVPMPEVYVTGNPYPNAFAGGVERPYITIRSSMIENLSDEELYHLIGHEIGHIKCGHVLYRSVARVLMPLLEMLGRRTLGLGDAMQIAISAAFLEWLRQAEVSCDRAGLLCSQSFELSARANLMLCSGPNRLAHEASTEAFLDQSRSYQDMGFADSIGKMMVFLFVGLPSTHPMAVHRTQELERWYESGLYDRILKGHYAKEENDSKPKAGSKIK